MARRIHALVVDDSGSTRKMIMKSLAETGLAEFHFTEAEDGVDALEKYHHDQTDVVFADMHMPRMDGVEFLGELRSRYRPCPPAVIITSENNRKTLEQAIAETRVDALLLKPVNAVRLRQGLKSLVDTIPDRHGECPVPYGQVVPKALKLMIQQACKVDLTSLPEQEQLRNGEAVLSMFSIVGGVQWSVVLGMEPALAAALASAFAETDLTPESPELGDALGELTNLIGGQIKRLLNQESLAVDASLATVIKTLGHEVLVQRRAKMAADYNYYRGSQGRMWSAVTVGVNSGLIL
jgi:CheY-like chemotaxis protein